MSNSQTDRPIIGAQSSSSARKWTIWAAQSWNSDALIRCQLDSGAQDQQIHGPDMKVRALPKPREASADALLPSHVSIFSRPMLGSMGPASITTVDQVMVEERAASFGKRSIKTSTKIAGLKMVSSMMDLTTLEGKDTPGK